MLKCTGETCTLHQETEHFEVSTWRRAWNWLTATIHPVQHQTPVPAHYATARPAGRATAELQQDSSPQHQVEWPRRKSWRQPAIKRKSHHLEHSSDLSIWFTGTPSSKPPAPKQPPHRISPGPSLHRPFQRDEKRGSSLPLWGRLNYEGRAKQEKRPDRARTSRALTRGATGSHRGRQHQLSFDVVSG